MRYTHFSSFQSHVKATLPNDVSRLYCIATLDDFERNEIVCNVIFQLKISELELYKFTKSEGTVDKVLDLLNSPSLMGDQPIIYLDEPDQKLLEVLLGKWKEPLTFGYFFIGLSSKPTYSLLEKYGIILDLIQERPWDRDKRWNQKLQEKARSLGKQMSAEVAAFMVQRLEPNAALLASHMEKLLTFCIDKRVIDVEDVCAVCAENRTQSLWKIAEELIWEHNFSGHALDVSISSFFYGFLFALRQQLLMGEKIIFLLDSNISYQKWAEYFPKIKPEILERRVVAAKKLGGMYFRNALDVLYDIELASKNHPFASSFLLDMVFFKLRSLISPYI